MSSPTVFVVAFEHAHRAFKCVRLAGSESADEPSAAAQWIVTMEGRTVWSLEARENDTRERVQREVEQWWDASMANR
jgi:hypothetical protein